MRSTKVVAALGAAGVAASLAVVGFAGPADAGTLTIPAVACTTTPNLGPQARDVTFTANMPDSVDAGSTFDIVVPGSPAEVPNNSGPPNNLAINFIFGVSNTYKISGATINGVSAVGTASINGTNIPLDAPIIAGDTVKTLLGGPLGGNIVPGALITPEVRINVTAGAAGGTVTIQGILFNT
ncbi:MAG: hypothetical protein SGJ13_02755, partial [Actinomycetota bacterium]|nr:hypothetical protein [Actinomycetota bacterium]